MADGGETEGYLWKGTGSYLVRVRRNLGWIGHPSPLPFTATTAVQVV